MQVRRLRRQSVTRFRYDTPGGSPALMPRDSERKRRNGGDCHCLEPRATDFKPLIRQPGVGCTAFVPGLNLNQIIPSIAIDSISSPPHQWVTVAAETPESGPGKPKSKPLRSQHSQGTRGPQQPFWKGFQSGVNPMRVWLQMVGFGCTTC